MLNGVEVLYCGHYISASMRNNLLRTANLTIRPMLLKVVSSCFPINQFKKEIQAGKFD